MDSRLDVNSLGLTSTLVAKLFDSLSNSLDATLCNLMNTESSSDRLSVYNSNSNISSGGTVAASSNANSTNTSSLSVSPTATGSSLSVGSSSSNIGSGGGSGGSFLNSAGSSSLKFSKTNTLARKLATSGKIMNIEHNETEWTNFARNFWFYYPSLMLISESSKYCKEAAIKLVLELLPKHIQALQSSASSASSPSSSMSLSPTLPNTSNVIGGSMGRTSISIVNSSNTSSSNNNNSNNPSVSPNMGGNIGFTFTTNNNNTLNINTATTTAAAAANNSTSPNSTSPSSTVSSSSSLVTILSSTNQSQVKMFSFDNFLSSIQCYHQINSDPKYLDLIESTLEIVVADIITHILGKVDLSSSSNLGSNISISSHLVNRLRDLAFFYFKPTNARSLNFSTWISLRLSISDQWSLILGQLSRVSLAPISNYLTKIVVSNPPLDELLPLFKGIRWVSLALTDSEKIIEVEKLIVQMLMWIEGNKKNVLRLSQLDALDGMLLSMNDFTQSSGIVEKMKLVYRRAEKLLKSDEFEEKSLKLMCTILSRGPHSTFDEEYDGIMKRIWKATSIQKKRDFSLECILRLLQGRFVPPRKITGLQTYLSSSSTSASTSIAAQLQQRLDRVYENSGSYLYAGLAFNRAKVIPRLQDMIQNLFGKKQNIPKIIESIELLSAISVHISVHSLKLLTDSILPTLFSSASPLHHAIALRTLSIILDPTKVFWNTAVSSNSRSITGGDNITFVSFEEIQLTFETFLTKSFKYCEEQAKQLISNSSASGGDGNENNPMMISTQFEPTISLYSLITETSQQSSKFENETTIEAIKRWYEVCTKTPEQREKELSDVVRVYTANLNHKINLWERSNDLLGQPSEPYPLKKKIIKKKTISPELLEFFKETIRCITFVPKNFIATNNLHKLVLFEDEEIASAASHAIQVIMCDHPEYRTTLVQGYTSLILQFVGKDHNSLQTLLSQLLGLIDLWNERSFIESRHSSTPLDSSFFPPKMLETEIEAIGLVHLSNPNPYIRMISLSIIRSVSGIRNTETKNTQIATVIHNCWRTIVQRARHQLLLDNAYGIGKDIKLNPTDELPSPEEMVCTTNERLWAFILTELGRLCTEYDCVRTLSKTRGILLNIIGNMPAVPVPLDANVNDDVKRFNNYTLRHLWINCHALLFSSSGISSIYPLKPTPQEIQDAMVDEMIKFEHNLQFKITSYLPNFWSSLLSDVGWIREKLSFICGLLHWRLIPCFINSLNEWWTNNKQNKKLSRVRVDLSNIFRRISQHQDFPRALFESQDLIQVFVQFIQQIDPIFGDPTKLPSIHNESYFNDNAVVVYNFCNSLFTPTLCALNGPIRKSLISDIKSIPWTVGERYKTFKAILQWSGHPKVSQARMNLEGVEINKKLSKCKDSAAREEEKERIETALWKIRSCSRLAAESIMKLGTLFEEGKLQQEVLEWVVDSEVKGNRILRWVLSYHFDEAYVYFLNKCYAENPSESVLYLHSIYDQFLPIPAQNPPTLGITLDIYQYYFDKALEERDQEELEDMPTTPLDKAFARKLTDIGASLLFLSLLNLLHPAFLARIRSFDLISRLCPCEFGLSNDESQEIRSLLLPKRQAFSSRNTPTNKLNASDVSFIVSQTCPQWTERLFEETFYRFRSLNSLNKKWTIQFLLPWCNNISFSDSKLTRNTPSEFLKALFTIITENIVASMNGGGGNNNNVTEIMPELIDLWLGLAKKDNQNLIVIINFLIKKGIVSKDSMPICRLLILHIYRMDPERTLEPLIYQLSYSGLVHNEKGLSNGLSDDDLDKSKQGPSSRHSNRIRETCVVILTDLLSENLNPIMPYVHILLNYSILRIDSNESAVLQKMVNVLLSALRNNLYAQTYVVSSNENDELKHQYRNILKSIDTILTSLRLPTFQIKFDFGNTNSSSSSNNSGGSNISINSSGSNSGSSLNLSGTSNNETNNDIDLNILENSVESIYSKRKSSFFAHKNNKNSNNNNHKNSRDYVMEHRDEMIKWCNGIINVDELISVLCKYFEALNPNTIDKWEAESLLWIKNYKDPRISIKACQMYRSIILCQQRLPNNLVNVNSKNQTLRRQKHRWASSVEHLVTLLQEWSEDLDQCLVRLSKLSNNANGTIGSIKGGSILFKQQQLSISDPLSPGGTGSGGSNSSFNLKTLSEHQNLAVFKRTLCVEILLSLKQIINSKNIDQDSVCLIFWSSVAFLVPTHSFYKPLFETSLSILYLMIIDQSMFSECNTDLYEKIVKQSKDIVIPRGIQYHLFKGLLSDHSEEITSQLLVEFFSIDSDHLVEPAGSPQRYILPILALIPWLHNRILTSKSSIIYREQKIVADKISINLATALENTINIPQNIEMAEIFKKYSLGGFNSNPDTFLISLMEIIRPQCIPKLATECADLIGALLENSQSLSTSIFKVTNYLLEGASMQVIPLFKNIIKIACDYGSSSLVAGDLIHLVVSNMKTFLPPPNSLPPFLPSNDKSSHDIIKQILLLIGKKNNMNSSNNNVNVVNSSSNNQELSQSTSTMATTATPINSSQEVNKKRGHRRNKSPITNHPSLKEKAINEKKSQPVGPPRFSNVFNPPTLTKEQKELLLNSGSSNSRFNNTNMIINNPKDDEEDDNMDQDEMDQFDQDEFDQEELKNIDDIIQGDEDDPTALQKALWRTSDEYNVYSLDIDEADFEGLEDLKVGLEGLDTNDLLNKFDSNNNSFDYEKSISTTTTTTTTTTGNNSTTNQTFVQQESTVIKVNNNNIDTNNNNNNDSIESLRALLGFSGEIVQDNSTNKRNSGTIQIDQLLTNLKSLDRTNSNLAQLEAEFDDHFNESPQSSFLNLNSSNNSNSSFKSSTSKDGSNTNLSTSTSTQNLGIKDILSDSKRRRAFLDFLKKQHFQKAVNDVCFVEVVNDFKADIEGSGEIGGDGLLYLMRHIVEGFVNENAKHPISITDKVREQVVVSYQNFISDGNNIDPTLFDVALEMVFKALEDKSILNVFLQQQHV
ncbi:hypothetical protein CYY_008685 [Polysphondylium violaceum]|uniref:RGS domain-containing protein n=1 Tax=Polysphondylium violaceum TaxID=133409 RepID=A0A8J4PMN7_9MYCE|nr:hypothetical protein CYY_008685 [Polysphondylium violaceum]